MRYNDLIDSINQPKYIPTNIHLLTPVMISLLTNKDLELYDNDPTNFRIPSYFTDNDKLVWAIELYWIRNRLQ